jgi:hypothetical protein
MEILASLFVGKPLNILALAVLFLGGYLALRFTALGIARHTRSLLSFSWARMKCSKLFHQSGFHEISYGAGM